MHIALVDPGEFSPPYDAALARGLMANGHRVTVIGQAGGPLAAEPGLAHDGHFYRSLDRPSAARLGPGAARAIKGLLHPFDMLRLPPALARAGVDLVHLQWAPLPLIDQACLAGLRRVAPVVLTVHDTVPYNGAEPWLMAAGMRRLTRQVDAVICHTEQGRRRLLRQGVAADRLHVVPHGLLGERRELPDSQTPPEGRIRLLQFGKIKPYKGVDVLLRALALLTADERRKLEVEIVGQPHMAIAGLRALARELEAEGTVRFELGFVPDAAMQAALDRAHALLFPYRDIEASGVLMQAVAWGKPVVASRIGIFAELLENGREALLVPPDNADALALALRKLSAAPERIAALRGAMTELRQRIPDWPAIGRRTLAVYASATAGHRNRTAAGRATSTEIHT